MYSGHTVYIIDVALLSIGFYGVLTSSNLIKRSMSLSIMQVATILLYLTVGYKGQNSIVPVYVDHIASYTNPLPTVLMLTAIVVGLAVTAVAFALSIRLKEEFGTMNSRIIDEKCHDDTNVPTTIQNILQHHKAK